MDRQSDYITEARQAARALWDAQLKLEALQAEWNALDYTNTLEDGEGENAGYTKTEVGAVVFDTANALRTLLDSGHATNLARLLVWLFLFGSVVNRLDPLALVTGIA